METEKWGTAESWMTSSTSKSVYLLLNYKLTINEFSNIVTIQFHKSRETFQVFVGSCETSMLVKKF
jgi:hypothetical protein